MNDKKMLYTSYVVAVVALLAFCFICQRIHSNGAGAGTVGKQLNQAKSTAQSVTESVSNAQATAGEIRQTSQDIGATIDSIQGTLISTGDSIENCERILAGIRARGKVQAVKN